MAVLLAAGLALFSSSVAVASGAGSGWFVQRTPHPRRFADSGLGAVSCVSSRACIAVGAVWGGHPYFTTTRPLAEGWNDRRWTIQRTPYPAGAWDSELNGVSCTSVRACVAVGVSYSNQTRIGTTLVERWNGRSWTTQPSPNPASPPNSALVDVSCASASACIAVGASFCWDQVGGPGRPCSYNAQTTLAEAWNGKTWTIQPTQNPSGAGRLSKLVGVSCASAHACTAVGTSGGKTLIERWNGHAWTIQPSPNTRSNTNDLLAVSCASASACTAVGYSLEINDSGVGGGGALIERWNGTTWTIQRAAHKNAGALYAVSCPSDRHCTAVGDYGGSLAERWDGNKWTMQRANIGSEGATGTLLGASCPSPTKCIAVGDHDRNAGGFTMLAERWSQR